jgi:uncharacterized phage protein (TIGR02220 family)
MSMLLIMDKPLMFSLSLAVKMGLTEAVILQKVQFWLSSSNNVKEGKKWIYSSYKDWQKEVPFWSESTIKRAIKLLEDVGILITANWNESKLDKTKWYSINYEKLKEYESDNFINLKQQSTIQRDIGTFQKVEEMDSFELVPEKHNPDIPYSEIIAYLNARTSSNYRSGTKKTKDLIQARWEEGFTLVDFQKVIDIKADEWLNDSQWSKFLRPITLFGPNFESYLNQKVVYPEEDFGLVN